MPKVLTGITMVYRSDKYSLGLIEGELVGENTGTVILFVKAETNFLLEEQPYFSPIFVN